MSGSTPHRDGLSQCWTSGGLAIQLVSRCEVIELRRKQHLSSTCVSNLGVNRESGHGWWQFCCRVNKPMTFQVMLVFTLTIIKLRPRSWMSFEVIIIALNPDAAISLGVFCAARERQRYATFSHIHCKHSSLHCLNICHCRDFVKRPYLNQRVVPSFSLNVK